MKLIRIYGLVNPINKTIFYVGATSKPLEKRLRQHISLLSLKKYENPVDGTPIFYRVQLFRRLKSMGLCIEIKLLEEASIRKANILEKKWYNKYNKSGDGLFQNIPGKYSSQLSGAMDVIKKNAQKRKLEREGKNIE